MTLAIVRVSFHAKYFLLFFSECVRSTQITTLMSLMALPINNTIVFLMILGCFAS